MQRAIYIYIYIWFSVLTHLGGYPLRAASNLLAAYVLFQVFRLQFMCTFLYPLCFLKDYKRMQKAKIGLLQIVYVCVT